MPISAVQPLAKGIMIAMNSHPTDAKFAVDFKTEAVQIHPPLFLSKLPAVTVVDLRRLL